MSRRITSNTVGNHDSDEAIQPRHNDHEAGAKEAPLGEPEAQASNDRSGSTVFHVASTKEVKREGGTVSSRVDHREETLIIYEHLPQSTACKEVAGGDGATRPSGSDQRLV